MGIALSDQPLRMLAFRSEALCAGDHQENASEIQFPLRYAGWAVAVWIVFVPGGDLPSVHIDSRGVCCLNATDF